MSLTNATRKYLKKLQQKKYRQQNGEFLLEGIKGVGEAVSNQADISLLVIEDKRKAEPTFQKIIKTAKQQGIEVNFCAQSDIGSIKTTDTFPGVLAVVKQPTYKLDDLCVGPIICLDNIKDPGNLGTIIRTADWFGLGGLLLSDDSVDVYNPKTVRSTMGSIFRVKILQSAGLIKDLNKLKKDYGYNLVGLTMDGNILDLNKAKNKTVYILGSESHGLEKKVEKMLDKRYTIAGKGEAESLNVAVAAGILMSKL